MQQATQSLVARVVAALRTGASRCATFGIGRQGGLAAARALLPAAVLSPVRRAMALVVGSLLIGTGVALLTRARLGLTPYDVLVSGLQPHVGLSFGFTVMLVAAGFALVAMLLGQRPNRWAVAYVVATGVAIDAVASLVNGPQSLLGRSSFVVAAVVALAGGIAIVVHAGCTGGSFELLMQAGAERGHDRRIVRTALELGTLGAGVALGGSFGPATIAVALTIGPFIAIAHQVLADHSTGRMMRHSADVLAVEPSATPLESAHSESSTGAHSSHGRVLVS